MDDYPGGVNSIKQDDGMNDSHYGSGGGGHALGDLSTSAYMQQPSSVSSSTTQKASSNCGLGLSGSPQDTSSPEENCISEDDNMDLGLAKGASPPGAYRMVIGTPHAYPSASMALVILLSSQAAPISGV
ncbi:hypothetical protein X801_06547 [Opisthorchis viverrini]|uniref:Uncharacterized protein n=1 Tax=Opisthorchis viverrini TaxID=6198 RepID=A0A1S8WTR1_OPIVI|nr:hypothetical protein X801_06547 [Opisthorchis viverrini]